jgi:hypothetical protein
MAKAVYRQPTAPTVERETIPDERIYMESYHDKPGCTLVLYDLADPEAWQRAGDELEAWGKKRTAVHRLGSEHVIIEYRAGGAGDLRELA